MSIFSWLSDRRVRARREAREQGYNYAAGMLLRGIPPSIIECSSRRGGHSTEFYIGMQGAVLAWDHMRYEMRRAKS